MRVFGGWIAVDSFLQGKKQPTRLDDVEIDGAGIVVLYSLTCVVRRAHNTYGDRCFATAGPRVWNSLPAELQSCDSLRQFKRCLKTFLFGSWDYGAL